MTGETKMYKGIYPKLTRFKDSDYENELSKIINIGLDHNKIDFLFKNKYKLTPNPCDLVEIDGVPLFNRALRDLILQEKTVPTQDDFVDYYWEKHIIDIKNTLRKDYNKKDSKCNLNPDDSNDIPSIQQGIDSRCRSSYNSIIRDIDFALQLNEYFKKKRCDYKSAWGINLDSVAKIDNLIILKDDQKIKLYIGVCLFVDTDKAQNFYNFKESKQPQFYNVNYMSISLPLTQQNIKNRQLVLYNQNDIDDIKMRLKNALKSKDYRTANNKEYVTKKFEHIYNYL